MPPPAPSERPKGRIEPGHQSGDRSDERSDEGNPRTQARGPGASRRDRHYRQDPQTGSDHPSHQARGRLDEELSGDVATGGSQGPPEPDLSHPLQDRNQRDDGDAGGSRSQIRIEYLLR